MKNAMRSMKNTSKYGYPTINLLNTRRCGARTRMGTPCKGPAVRGRRRCRMHGAFAGRPKDPLRQMLLYNQAVRRHFNKFCLNCELINKDCSKIYAGDCLPENFQNRIQKYCLVSIREKKVLKF